MKRYIPVFTKAILAGILIGISGIIYLTLADTHKIIGALMFGFGLLVICANGLNLFTGKVGYLIDKNGYSFVEILIMVVGNFIGTGLVALIVYLSGLHGIIDVAQGMVDGKLSHPWYEVLGLAMMCGVMMYLAVEGYKRIKNEAAKVVIVIFAVAIFILGKFEHSIADMFYFSVSLSWNMKAILYFVIMLIGNGIGAIGINLLEKWSKLKE